MALRKLYPPLRPYASGFLERDGGHSLYWEQCGNPDGVPVVVLHGGPGAGCSPDMRRFFDPRFYRIVLFDQRGCGRSSPAGDVTHNTPEHLVADMESLRVKLRIERWHLFGGSWGATLAMLYAAAHSSRVISMILRSVFLLTRAEVDWFLYGTRKVFPEVWQRFVAAAGNPPDVLSAYHDAVFAGDEAAALDAGVAWASFEGACSTLYPQYQTFAMAEERAAAWALARIETHFYSHHARADDGWIVDALPAFRQIPTVLIHGRYDMITPLETAHRLHTLWPEADYVVVPDGAHSAFEPPMRDRLIAAADNAKSIRW